MIYAGMSSQAEGFFAGLIEQGLPGKQSYGFHTTTLVVDTILIREPSALFGMSLTARDVGSAELTIGGYDKSKFQGNIPILFI